MAQAGVAAEPALFTRKSTGLVKGWSMFDAFIYATLSINLITLGFGYAFTGIAVLPQGALITAAIVSGLLLLFEVIVYASLIAIMPRAGGDYVWISRVFGGGIGFVFAATGWWFILWHWTPIYSNILATQVIQPTLTVLGVTGTGAFEADWWPYSATNGAGNFVTSLLVIALATIVVSLGMRSYARIQKWCFFGGMVGLIFMIVLFAVHSHADWISAYNDAARDLYGVKGGNAYKDTVAAGGGLHVAGATEVALRDSLLLIPFLLFWNLYPNWGATLYGEVRGASDFRKNIYAMGGAVVFTTILAVIALGAIAHSVGLDFYGILSGEYWQTVTEAPFYLFPYPGTMASFFLGSDVLRLLLIWLLGLWFLGWVGTLFLSSTRMIFAAAFDRILPEAASKVHQRSGVPYVALLLMFVGSIPIAALYAFSTDFYTYTLDATLVIAVMFFVTTLAALVLPWWRRDIYQASAVARYRILGAPLITVSAAIFAGFLGWVIYKWFTDDVYFVNDASSLRYLVALYLLALVIYVIARIIRRRQGIELSKVNAEIPVE